MLIIHVELMDVIQSLKQSAFSWSHNGGLEIMPPPPPRVTLGTSVWMIVSLFPFHKLEINPDSCQTWAILYLKGYSEKRYQCIELEYTPLVHNYLLLTKNIFKTIRHSSHSRICSSSLLLLPLPGKRILKNAKLSFRLEAE